MRARRLAVAVFFNNSAMATASADAAARVVAASGRRSAVGELELRCSAAADLLGRLGERQAAAELRRLSHGAQAVALVAPGDVLPGPGAEGELSRELGLPLRSVPPAAAASAEAVTLGLGAQWREVGVIGDASGVCRFLAAARDAAGGMLPSVCLSPKVVDTLPADVTSRRAALFDAVACHARERPLCCALLADEDCWTGWDGAAPALGTLPLITPHEAALRAVRSWAARLGP
eukprot:TRINITY_DN31999_c0_g1_i1.p1 TRINITY_DN31999_c0_g1~~TRINITY_DN31999_c0_g1_i1.p1  ORF type:complete len:233 (+),score=48.21 TRINITY_DN31999_c0_g1_i1:77-775(+)